MSGQAVELPLRQLLEVRQLEVPQLLKSQPPRRKRKKKVKLFTRLPGFCSHPARKGRIRRGYGLRSFRLDNFTLPLPFVSVPAIKLHIHGALRRTVSSSKKTGY